MRSHWRSGKDLTSAGLVQLEGGHRNNANQHHSWRARGSPAFAEDDEVKEPGMTCDHEVLGAVIPAKAGIHWPLGQIKAAGGVCLLAFLGVGARGSPAFAEDDGVKEPRMTGCGEPSF